MNEIDDTLNRVIDSITTILANQKLYLAQGRDTQQKIHMWRRATKDINVKLDAISSALSAKRYIENQVEATNWGAEKLALVEKLPLPEGDTKQILHMPCYLFFRKVSESDALSSFEKRQLSALYHQVWNN